MGPSIFSQKKLKNRYGPFYSLRYTPLLFENLLRREGFDFDLLSITACRQEAIWSDDVMQSWEKRLAV